MANLKLNNIVKSYDNGFKAVKNFNLNIQDKEFIVFVGPSGCGKSTTLRMIAGLEEISSGELYIDDVLVNNIEPKNRDIAMVFQNYALYPHMTVYENMAFALTLRKASKKEIDEKVRFSAKILDLENLLDRKPKALSGGQRQRVAMGRAIVRHPKVFLMDEPLSNLDAKLRVQMRIEIAKLHKKLDATFIYVTHDQTEAMTLGSRIVVMKDGIIMQVDSPKNIYEKPKNIFVASFIGSPQMNFLDGLITEKNDDIYLNLLNKNLKLSKPQGIILKEKNYIDKDVIIGIRPEHIHCSKEKATFLGEIEVSENLGSETILYTKVSQKNILVKTNTSNDIKTHDPLYFDFDLSKLHFFDKNSEESIL